LSVGTGPVWQALAGRQNRLENLVYLRLEIVALSGSSSGEIFVRDP
jgi:accessory colonization factor AcfC